MNIPAIVATLVNLNGPETGVPPHGRDGHRWIKNRYRLLSANPDGRDPMLVAAEEWLSEQITPAKPEEPVVEEVKAEEPAPEPEDTKAAKKKH